MASKIIVLCAALAIANAGYLGAPAAVTYSAAPAVSHVTYSSPVVSYGTPAITSQYQNILRSPGNLAQVSTYSKAIDTPFSSVRKSDVRVSNPGLAVAAAPAYAYAAPAYHAGPALSYASAAPALSYAAAAPAISYSSPLVTRTYSSPAISYSAGAPLIKSYAAPTLSYATAAPAVSYAAAAPAVTYAKTYAAPTIASHGLLGTAYSAAPAVAHVSYSGNYGLNYAW